MTNDRNPFDDATAVADQAELLELQKPRRNYANVVKRDRAPSQPAPVPTPSNHAAPPIAAPNSAAPSPAAPSPAAPSPAAPRSPHVIRRGGAGLPEDSSEVLLTPANASPQGKPNTTSDFPGHSLAGQNGGDEFTVEEGRPQPPAALISIAEQASLAVAPPDDPNRGFLIITSGNDAGRRVGLPEGRTTIGRGIDCDIVLTDITVSRRHMYVERRDNVYFLCDLSSGNGTIVNSQDRRGEVVVVNGDTFQIGNTVFSLEGPEAQEAASTTNWHPEDVPGGNPAPRGLSPMGLAEDEEESTVAGKGLSSSLIDDDPPSELPTNIVASVEIEPQLRERQRPATRPPPLPQDKENAREAAIAALSSIEHTPPPYENSVIPIETDDLAALSVPPTSDSAMPYPIPGRQQAEPHSGHMPSGHMPGAGQVLGGHMPGAGQVLGGHIPGAGRIPTGPQPPHSGHMPTGPQPSSSVPGLQGHMGAGVAPMQFSPNGMPGGYPVPGNVPQGSSPMMNRPMMAGGRPDFHNPYQPAGQVQEPPARGKLLIGLISVALVLTAVGIVATVVSQGDEAVKTPESVVAASPGVTPRANAPVEGEPTAPLAVASAADGGEEPKAAAPDGPAKSEPILVASLIAGNTQLPASTWGTDESFQAELTEEAPEAVEPDVVEPDVVEPDVVEPKPRPAVSTQNTKKPKVVRKPREPKPRERKPAREDKPDKKPSGGSVDISSVKSAARALYKRRDFGKAASTLEKAANRIDDDNDAMKLSDIADAYKKVGTSLEKAERAQNSNPVEALDLYKKALSQDKKYASGTLSKLIRLRIGQVAPKAAKALMAKGKLPQAKKAADTAKRYDEGQAVEAVYKSLERKANSLIKKALKAKKKGNEDEAKDLLREATSIAPKGTGAYEKCRAELRKF